MSGKIYYLNLTKAPPSAEGGAIGFFEPDIARLAKPVRKKSKLTKRGNMPVPGSKNTGWKKPMNGKAVRRKRDENQG